MLSRVGSTSATPTLRVSDAPVAGDAIARRSISARMRSMTNVVSPKRSAPFILGVPGVKFIWYDAMNKSLRANQTGPDTLLEDRTDVHRTSMTIGGAPTAIFTDFELVWTEAATFDGEVSENLFYAPVSCLK